MTEDGHQFAVADIQTRKRIFRQKVLENVTFARKIHEALIQQTRHVLAEEFFEDILDEHFTADEVTRQMDTIIDWGRYAELFEYDGARKVLMLSNPEAPGKAGQEADPTLHSID